MSAFGRREWNFVVAVIAIASIAVLAYWRPWIKEVWITTTPAAFAGRQIVSSGEENVAGKLNVAITPAPWPEEASEIWKQAKRGRVVHVTLVSGNSIDKFDITGVTPGGSLLVDIRAMSEPQRIRNLLGLNYNRRR